MTTINTHLQVTFFQLPNHLGWIDMNVVWPLQPGADGSDTSGARASCARMSCVYCAFPSLVSWMEAVARGVEPAAVQWDDEGRDVELVYGSGSLFFSNRDHEGWWQTEIPATEVAATFYSAFRDFVQTGYDRTQYETIRCLREVFVGQLRGRMTLTQLLLSIAALPANEAARRFAQLARGHYQSMMVAGAHGNWDVQSRCAETLFAEMLMRSWDAASRSRRLRLLRRFMGFRISSPGSESALSSLRSRLIERHVLPAVRTT